MRLCKPIARGRVKGRRRRERCPCGDGEGEAMLERVMMTKPRRKVAGVKARKVAEEWKGAG